MAKGINKGNKNAEKWTFEKAEELFNTVLEKTKEKTDYILQGQKIEGFNCHYIGEAADEAGTNCDILDYLKKKYPELRKVYSSIKRKCERNCFTDSKKGIIIASMAIINLKSNHNWTDRVDNTSKGNEIKPERTTIKFVKK